MLSNSMEPADAPLGAAAYAFQAPFNRLQAGLMSAGREVGTTSSMVI